LVLQGLDYETKYLSFLDVHQNLQEYAPGAANNLVPVIIHDGKVVQDSFEISKYLDKELPSPSLHHNQENVHRFFGRYFEGEVVVPLRKLVLLKVFEELDEKNQKYFRESREKRMGCPLEEFTGDPEEHIVKLIELFKPIEGMLKENAWISGSQIGWSDVLVAGWLSFLEAFQPKRLQQVLGEYPNASEWWKNMEQYRKKRD
jgi:glutathione S-transferase